MQKIKFIVLEQVSILKNNRVNQFSKGTLINDDLMTDDFRTLPHPSQRKVDCTKNSRIFFQQMKQSTIFSA